MAEQFELFKTKKPLSPERIKEKESWRKGSTRLPDARGYNIIGGFAERIIAETREEHTCRICGNIIPAGFRAREIIEVVDGKLLVHSKEYAHTKGQCPPITE